MGRKTSLWLQGAVFATAVVIVPDVGAQQNSPIGQGSWIISGAASFASNHDNRSDQSITIISVSPSGLFFVRPRLAVGGSASVGYLSTTSGTSKSFGLGPSARYYFGDSTGKLFPFISATFAPTWQSSNPKSSTVPDVTVRNMAIDGSIGLTRLVASHVGVTGEAYYTHLSSTAEAGSSKTTSTSYVLGLRFGITAFVF